MLAVITILPATVPVNKRRFAGNTALKVFAVIVNGVVLEPVENRTAASSPPTALLGTNVIVSVPVIVEDGANDDDICIGNCCAAFTVAGNPDNDSVLGGGAAVTVTVNALLVFAPRVSAA